MIVKKKLCKKKNGGSLTKVDQNVNCVIETTYCWSIQWIIIFFLVILPERHWILCLRCVLVSLLVIIWHFGLPASANLRQTWWKCQEKRRETVELNANRVWYQTRKIITKFFINLWIKKETLFQPRSSRLRWSWISSRSTFSEFSDFIDKNMKLCEFFLLNFHDVWKKRCALGGMVSVRKNNCWFAWKNIKEKNRKIDLSYKMRILHFDEKIFNKNL